MAAILFPLKELFVPDQKDFLETARYLGYKKVNPPEGKIQFLIEQCAKEMHAVLLPKACYEKFPLELISESDTKIVKFADVQINSVNLSRNLHDCSWVYIFAVTIGPQVDALIRRYEKLDSVKVAILQSCGAMFVEKVVDYVNELIKNEASKENAICHPRFSPGYGDVKLEVQKDFFNLLPCSKLGLSLMDTLIMAPEKSVTAFIGVEKIKD